jgi:hypothetical protein
MYKSTYSRSRHYLEVSVQIHTQVALPPEKETPVTIGQEVVRASEPVWATWRGQKLCNYRDSNSEISVFQPAASRYTNCFIPAYFKDL